MEKQVPLTLLKVGLKDQVASLIRMVLDITGETTVPDWMLGEQPIIDRLHEDKQATPSSMTHFSWMPIFHF